MTDIKTSKHGDRELRVSCELEVTPDKPYRAWTDPELLPHWFCPRPWGVSRARMDVRPGGASEVVMRSPEGQEFPNPGQFLEVVPNQRLVFTDAYLGDWQPSSKPFMTVVLRFEALPGGRTRYIASVNHWNADDCAAHEKMGFHEGWKMATEQLAELVAQL
jgi:uncharacterized protein YndB with AHSA1/START domain